ncbi:MAG: PDZ domain-containing protein [Phycisphaerae bacterium]|nr:PDZ domain-containing protein [Phycisphaerae bacterium]
MKNTTLASIALVLSLSGGLSAWPGQRAAVVNEFGQPAGRTARVVTTMDDAANPTRTGYYQIWTDDVHYFIRVQDGKVLELKKNGESIPADRVTVTADRVVVLDDQGKVIMDAAAGSPRAGDSRPRVTAFRGSFARGPMEGQAAGFDPEAPKPPVMVGVRMAQPSPALLRHLKIEPGKAILVAGVAEGLPAAQAGLKPYDLLVAVNDTPVTSENTLREVLTSMKAKPGDTIRLSVVQEGQRKELNVTLSAFDEDKMMNGKWEQVESDDMPQWSFAVPQPPVAGQTRVDMEDVQKRLMEAQRRSADAMREAERQMERSRRDRLTVIPPGVTADPQIFMDTRRSGLDERMARLEERLMRLEELLNRLAPPAPPAPPGAPDKRPDAPPAAPTPPARP